MMQESVRHRKTLRHYDEPGHAHELTFSCYKRLPLLKDRGYCVELARGIDRAVDRHGFELIAFVFMPEHVHLLVWPIAPTARVAPLLFAMKRPVSFRIKQAMKERGDPWLDRLMIRERPGKTTFRFWQEGAGYDRNITNAKTLRTAIDYVHHNPVRRGICASPDAWPWSSWNFYWAPENWPADGSPRVHGFVE
jgi:putative transposase